MQRHLQLTFVVYTDKKENKIFLIYKEIQKGSVAKSYMTITASSYIWLNICALPHILGSPSFVTDPIRISLHVENFVFFSISVLSAPF